jgi:hypothetical protein
MLRLSVIFTIFPSSFATSASAGIMRVSLAGLVLVTRYLDEP